MTQGVPNGATARAASVVVGALALFQAGSVAALELQALWSAPVTEAVTSSPLTVDLTGDGYDDVVALAGVEKKFGKVHAIDGRTGKALWERGYPDDLYASPIAIQGLSAVPAILIGGRIDDLRLLDGRNGKELWGLRRRNPTLEIPPTHFNTPVPVGDRNGDGVTDVLALQSGGQDATRPPGRIYLVSGRDGKVLNWGLTPDQRESYSVPAVVTVPKGIRAMLGTGGETIGGSIVSVLLPAEGALQQRWRGDADRLGFIASPLWMRLPSARLDWVVGASYGGVVEAREAESGKPVWRQVFADRLIAASPSPVRRAGAAVPDVVVAPFQIFQKGSAEVVWLDGRSGKIRHRVAAEDVVGASPLAVDLDGDGFDETIVVRNRDFIWTSTARSQQGGSALLIYDGATYAELVKRELKGYTAATPVLADFGRDGSLELIVAYRTAVECLRISGKARPSPTWSRYRGESFNGVYER